MDVKELLMEYCFYCWHAKHCWCYSADITYIWQRQRHCYCTDLVFGLVSGWFCLPGLATLPRVNDSCRRYRNKGTTLLLYCRMELVKPRYSTIRLDRGFILIPVRVKTVQPTWTDNRRQIYAIFVVFENGLPLHRK